MSLNSLQDGRHPTDYPLLRSLLTSPPLFLADIKENIASLTQKQAGRSGKSKKRKVKKPPAKTEPAQPARCSPDTTVNSPPAHYVSESPLPQEIPLSEDQENTLLSIFSCNMFSDSDRFRLAARIGIGKNRVLQWVSRHLPRKNTNLAEETSSSHNQVTYKVPDSEVDYFALGSAYQVPKRLKVDNFAYGTSNYSPDYALSARPRDDFFMGLAPNGQSIPYYGFSRGSYQDTQYHWHDAEYRAVNRPGLQYHSPMHLHGSKELPQARLPNCFPEVSQQYHQFTYSPSDRPTYYYDSKYLADDIKRLEFHDPKHSQKGKIPSTLLKSQNNFETSEQRGVRSGEELAAVMNILGPQKMSNYPGPQNPHSSLLLQVESYKGIDNVHPDQGETCFQANTDRAITVVNIIQETNQTVSPVQEETGLGLTRVHAEKCFQNMTDVLKEACQSISIVQAEPSSFGDVSFWEDVERSIEKYSSDTAAAPQKPKDEASACAKDDLFTTTVDLETIPPNSIGFYPEMFEGASVEYQRVTLNTSSSEVEPEGPMVPSTGNLSEGWWCPYN